MYIGNVLEILLYSNRVKTSKVHYWGLYINKILTHVVLISWNPDFTIDFLLQKKPNL